MFLLCFAIAITCFSLGVLHTWYELDPKKHKDRKEYLVFFEKNNVKGAKIIFVIGSIILICIGIITAI